MVTSKMTLTIATSINILIVLVRVIVIVLVQFCQNLFSGSAKTIGQFINSFHLNI